MLPIATTLPAPPLEPPVEHVTISDDESNENEAASAEDLRQSALATCGTSQGGYVSGGTEIDSGSEAEPPEFQHTEAPEFQLTEAPALQHTEAPDLQQCAETLIEESPELHNAVAPGWEHTVHTHTHQSSGSGRFRCSPHEKLRNLIDRAVREGASKSGSETD